MGLFEVRLDVYSLQDPRKVRTLPFIVDTGATLSVIPREVADELDIRAEEKRLFQLANGSRVARDIGHAGFEYEGRWRLSTVVIGEPGDVPLLGAVTLETLGHEVDPVNRTLRPTEQYLLHAAPTRPVAGEAFS